MDIQFNIEQIRKRMMITAQNVGRNPNDIELVVVTKTHPAIIIEEALAAGAHCIGENKVQEAASKLPMLTDNRFDFHFIGHLQANKVNKLLELDPVLIHSLDSLSVAEKLQQRCDILQRDQAVLIQVNTTNEESKSGLDVASVLPFLVELEKYPRLKVKGLMTIGLYSENAEDTRPYFKILKQLQDTIIQEKIPWVEMQHLSMGMTNDFEVAIEEGATIVRIGSAIFGARLYPIKE